MNKGSITYTVEVDPPPDYMFRATSTSVLCGVSYNTYYNMTVIARNCKGKTTHATTQLFYGRFILYTIKSDSILINLGNCGHPAVNDSVTIEGCALPSLNGSSITFSCSPGRAITGPTKATCDNNGQWNPSPTTVQCLGMCGLKLIFMYASI